MYIAYNSTSYNTFDTAQNNSPAPPSLSHQNSSISQHNGSNPYLAPNSGPFGAHNTSSTSINDTNPQAYQSSPASYSVTSKYSRSHIPSFSNENTLLNDTPRSNRTVQMSDTPSRDNRLFTQSTHRNHANVDDSRSTSIPAEAPANAFIQQAGAIGKLPLDAQETAIMEDLFYAIMGINGEYIYWSSLHSFTLGKRLEASRCFLTLISLQ